jgi:hypothetical protein
MPLELNQTRQDWDKRFWPQRPQRAQRPINMRFSPPSSLCSLWLMSQCFVFRFSLMPINISDLIPKDKLDLATANAAGDAGYPAVAPILAELLAWLQDCNWPVAHVLAPFLASIGEPLVPHVAKIMESDDYVWKYWMIGAIMRHSPDVARSFRSELERLVNSPTQVEAHEQLDQLAAEVLELYGWTP